MVVRNFKLPLKSFARFYHFICPTLNCQLFYIFDKLGKTKTHVIFRYLAINICSRKFGNSTAAPYG